MLDFTTVSLILEQVILILANLFLSSDKEYCVLAIHIGKFLYLELFNISICFKASSLYITSLAPYILVHTLNILVLISSSKSSIISY